MKEFDVIIIGAGLSGIGAACHLEQKCPGKSYVLLESRSEIGGTWDLFRYPGIRSDSDMASMSYNFKAWKSSKVAAAGEEIKKYIIEAAREYEVTPHIRFSHKVKTINWSSQAARWFVTVENNGQLEMLSGKLINFCGGYYSYEKGFTPDFKNLASYQGKVIHSQHWPEDYDYSGKSMIVIGSGATAITLVPSLAQKAESVTMLQRSPTYLISMPKTDYFAKVLYFLLPLKWWAKVVRWKNINLVNYIYSKSRREPQKMKAFLVGMVRKAIGDVVDVEKHFTPRYNPWDQRLCLVMGGDLYRGIQDKKVKVVTDTIKEFSSDGIILDSGKTLEADAVVLATGLNLLPLGGIAMEMDGKAVSMAERTTFMGVMTEGIPNFVQTFGYINASWTLRADLIADYFCKILNHMNESGTDVVTPTFINDEKNMGQRPFVENFSSGYMKRAVHLFPKQGEHWPWVNCQNYKFEKEKMIEAPLDLKRLRFARVELEKPVGLEEPNYIKNL